MWVITIFMVAVGLSMDALAISVISGSAYRHLQVKHALRIGAFFGGFQALMPLVGALAGLTLRRYIAAYDHWAAFAILAAVGGKMLYESAKIKSAKDNFDVSNLFVLLVLSIATSIDALAVGITLPLLKVPVVGSAAIIGLTTFVLCYVGVFVGKKFGSACGGFESKIEAIGGLILIALGVKIVLQHILS
jgi:putative Mn2+ efflux pump MntP